MALDLTQLKRDYQAPKTEIDSEMRRQFGKMKNQIGNVFANLGIYTDEKGFEKTKTGKPRFFEIGPDGTIKNALEGITDVKSDAFLEKIAKGNVFTFPAGQEKPVQITANSYGYIEFSKPLDRVVIAEEPKVPIAPKAPVAPTVPVEPTVPHKPKALSGWKRFINAITFGAGYKKDVTEYNAKTEQYEQELKQYDKKSKQYKQELEQYDKKSKQYEQEMKQYDKKSKQYEQDQKEYPKKWAEYERQASTQAFTQLGLDRIKNGREPDDMKAELADEGRKEQALFDAAMDKNYVSELDAKLESMSNFYRPHPVQNKELTGLESGQCYTQEQFDKLRPINISGIKIGGKQLTDDQFAALAMCAAMMPDIGGKENAKDYAGDNPFTYEEQSIINNTFYTCDLGKDRLGDPKDKQFRPREKAGTYFGPIIHMGRKYAELALREYTEKGTPLLLSKLIAYGAKFQMLNQVHKPLDRTDQLMNEVMIGRIADVAMADRKLTAAVEKEGVTSQMLWGLKGTQKLADVYRENERAETLLRLDSNKKFTTGLSKEEREECVKSRLQFVAVNESIRQHAESREKTAEYQEALGKAMAEMPALVAPATPKEGETPEEFAKRNARKKQIGPLIAQNKIDLAITRNFGMPKVFMAAAATNGLEHLTNSLIPNQDKLMNLKGQELEDALKDPALVTKSLADAQKEKHQNTPTVQKQVQKTMDMGLQAG